MRAQKIRIAFVVLLVGFMLATLHAADSGPDAVAETRQSLRTNGFKTDLADFDFTTTAEVQKRETILDLSMGYVRGRKPAVQMPPPIPPSWRDRLPPIDPMPRVGDDAVIVIWKQEHLISQFVSAYPESRADTWPALRIFFDKNQSDLDDKCAAILSGPIRFNLEASTGHAMLLPHLAGMKQLGQTLGMRAALALHDQNRDAAWTNLLAETRLATAWEPEPLEISHLVRFGCATIAAQTTWQTLQTNAWDDKRLARLQAEWESVNYFKNLPDTAAYARACAAATCQLERADRSELPSVNALVREPKSTVGAYMQNRRYSHAGSYDDEKGLLLHYRDREVELRNAVKCTTWVQMRQLPGVTNMASFNSTNGSRTLAMINMKALTIGFQRDGASFIGRAAEVEAQRRVIVTAIALERFHIQHGAYPRSLAELSPGLLAEPMADFIDGKPLRYLLTGEHFVLYSIGLDGIDDGGILADSGRGWIARLAYEEEDQKPHARKPADLVWPRPASDKDITTFEQQERAAVEAVAAKMEERKASAQWDSTERRQQHARELLDRNSDGVTNGVMYKGHPLVDFLRVRNAPVTNKLSLAEMLTLRQVVTGDEPETVTFEAPVAFDAVRKLGRLQLFVDPMNESDSEESCAAIQFEYKRSTNGNCLIALSTAYECPGTHALQLGLQLREPDESIGEICGPLLEVTVSNLCQFSTACASYDLETGALFHAKLPELNGTYVIDMADTNGVHLKAITGNATNGVIKERWDLVDERAVRFTNGVFNCIFDLTLPESGRRQKIRL